MYSWYTYTYTSMHFIKDSERVNVVFSVCVLLIKILLANIDNPVKHFCLTEGQVKTNTETKASKQITQHTGYNSTNIQQSTNVQRAKQNYSLRDTWFYPHIGDESTD